MFVYNPEHKVIIAPSAIPAPGQGVELKNGPYAQRHITCYEDDPLALRELQPTEFLGDKREEAT